MDNRINKKMRLWSIILIGVIIANVISQIYENNYEKVKQSSIQNTKDITIIEKCINNYKFLDEENIVDKKITIVDKDKYGRYLVDVEIQHYSPTFNTYNENIARVVLYDVKEDGTSKMYGYSPAMPFITGASKGYEKSIEDIKNECNWNKPIE